jgi:MFS family permease
MQHARGSGSWLELEDTNVETKVRTVTPWLQLTFVWLVFVVTAGVYQVPATLLGGHCADSTAPCSIADELGLSPALQGWLPASFLLCKGLLALPAGVALHAYGPRRCLVLGIAMLAISTALFAVARSFYMLLLLYVAFGISYSLSGLVPLVVFVNGWFSAQQKATSIGLLVTAFSAAGVFWPPLTAWIAERHGWRLAAALLPCAAVAFALPIALFLLRDGRVAAVDDATIELNACSSIASSTHAAVESGIAEVGRAHHGASMHAAVESGTAEVSRAHHGAVRCARGGFHRGADCLPAWVCDPVLWHLAAMSFEILYIINAVQALLILFLCSEEVGMTLTSAGMYSSLIFALSLVAKIAFGPALDRSSTRRPAALFGCSLLALGCGLTLRVQRAPGGGPFEVLTASSHPQLVAFSVCFGLGYGSSFTLVQSRAAALYGQLEGFSKLQSTLAVAQYAGSFLGVLVTAQLRQSTGSFVQPFGILTLLGLLSCVHCWFVCSPGGPRGL